MIEKKLYDSDYNPLDKESITFEGDYTFYLKISVPKEILLKGSYPYVKSATATIKSVKFIGSIWDGDGFWGATQELDEDGNPILDFHKRRTFNKIILTDNSNNLTGTFELSIETGGTWIRIKESGEVASPSESPAFTLDEKFQPLTAQKLKVGEISSNTSEVQPNGKTLMLKAQCISCLSNLNLRVDDQTPFWSYFGEFSDKVSTQTTPDFSNQLNEYLRTTEYKENDECYYWIPMVLHSDSLGKVALSVDVKYVLVKDTFAIYKNNIFVKNVTEANLNFTCQDMGDPEVPKIGVELPSNAQICKALFHLKGGFTDTRIIDELSNLDISDYSGVTISSEYSVAQEILPEKKDYLVKEIDLYLLKLSEKGEIKIDLREDADGTPSADSLTSTSLTWEEKAEEKFSWICLEFEDEIKIESGKRYWIVLNTIEGEMIWRGNRQINWLLFYSSDGAVSWERYAFEKTTELEEAEAPSKNVSPEYLTIPFAGVCRIHHRPKEYEIPISMKHGTSEKSLEEFKVLGTIDFDVALVEENGSMLVSKIIPFFFTSKCAGELVLSNLWLEYIFERELKDEIVPPISIKKMEARKIHGVGLKFEEILRGLGVQDLWQLAQLDYSLIDISMTPVRLLEFKTKACLILDTCRKIDKPPFEALLGWALSDIIETHSDELCSITGQSKKSIESLKMKMGILQVSLDDPVIKELKLKNLIWEL